LNSRRKLIIALGASALPASLAKAQGKTPRIGYMGRSTRNRTLVVFNTNAVAVTKDGKTSEQIADYFAEQRGYGAAGQYFKLGVDFGGRSYGVQKSFQMPDYNALKCAKSYPDDPRYAGQLLTTAIKNIVNDNGLWAVFVESMVPNTATQYGGNAPDGRYFALCAGSARMPFGRIGWPGCNHADIARIVADANWAETQVNTNKLHLIGGTGYIGGGDTEHMVRANASFAARVLTANMRAFDQDGAHAGGRLVGSVVSYGVFDAGKLSPQLDGFGMLWSRNPETDATGWLTLNQRSWKPQRGGWAFDWGSNAYMVGYETLKRGGCCAILNEIEPNSNGLPAVDYVATALMAGKTMAEANSGSLEMQVANCSVYGVPDYAPYAIR